jgi:hypothetical protein
MWRVSPMQMLLAAAVLGAIIFVLIRYAPLSR